MDGSSLSSVVSGLVRAQMGSSLPGTVTDEDLDRCIGEIILREAKAKAERYKKEGIRAYLPKSDPNAPKTNKRFLSSIIRSTDDHNKALLRAQAIAAAKIREINEEQERRERRARAEEATRDRKRKLRRGESEDRWRPDRGRDHGRRQKRDWAKKHWSISRSRSRSPKRQRYWDEGEEEYEERIRSYRRRSQDKDRQRKRHHRDDSRSQSPSGSHSSSRSSSRSPSRHRDKGKGKLHEASRSRERAENSNRHRHRIRSCSPATSHRQIKKQRRKRSISPSSDALSGSDSKRHHKTNTLSCPASPATPKESHRLNIRADLSKDILNSPTPGPPSPEPSMGSKMDKYFDPSYDPRLDVAPLASKSGLTVDVPATGLIDNAQFEGWDAMLELIRQRREDRAEKKRLERLGLLPDRAKDGRGKKGKGMISGISEGKGIMDFEYTKRGAVREWDMGKEVT